MSDTAQRLREGMDLRDMKQSELSERTGISKGALSSYLSGRYAPKQNNIFLIAKALNVSEAWLMGADVPMERINDNINLPSQTLKPDEEILLSTYRTLNDQGKQNVLDYAKFTAEKYSIDGYEPELLAAHARAGADPEDVQSDLDLVKRLTLNKKNH